MAVAVSRQTTVLVLPRTPGRDCCCSASEGISRIISAMSPTVFREGGFRFYFFSREETRMHVHVQGQSGEAKFWLDPAIEIAQ